MENKINKKVPIIILTAASFLLSFGPILKWLFYTIMPSYSYSATGVGEVIITFLISGVLYLVWGLNIAFLEEKLNKPFGLLATYAVLAIKLLVDAIFEIIYIIESFAHRFYGEAWSIIESISGIINIIVCVLAIIASLALVIFLFVDKEKMVKTISMIVMAILIIGVIISFILGCITSVIFLIKYGNIIGIIGELVWLLSILTPIPFYASIMLYFKANKVPSFKKVEETEEVIEVREAE